MPPYGGHGWPLFLISLIPIAIGLYGIWDFCLLMVKGSRYVPWEERRRKRFTGTRSDET